ncbi:MULTISPECIES: CU044_5270 family protein [Streptomyces violaceusniger group]|uniref:CU044_5270 family protein n=2 Tax=Streptomyces javensis TaxID=114698 RepID=A0ABN1XA67_9ACTN|nr:CU044_5270 family protein [Streptomyces javensis]MBI0313616.1 CU044_5270 family protein [Streptomyces javensis]
MNTNPRRPDQPVDHQELAELLPAPGRPVLRRDRHRVLREHLMEHIGNSDKTVHERSGTTSTSPASRARRRLVLIAAPLALAAVVGVGAVAVDAVRDDGKGGATATGVGGTTAEHRQAAQLLDRIAVVAAARPAVTVRDDQFIYTKSRGSSAVWGGPTKPVRDAKGDITGTRTYKGTVQSDEWQPVTGKTDGLRRLTALTPDDGFTPSRKQDITMAPGAGYLTFRELQALPTDPDALLRKLESGNGVVKSRLTETVFENVGAILDQATLLPDLSAALYRAVAKLPDVRVVKNVKDGAGRTGIGLTYTNRGNPSKTTKGYWVFDPKSLAYLGTDRSALLDVAVTDDKGKVTAVGAS